MSLGYYVLGLLCPWVSLSLSYSVLGFLCPWFTLSYCYSAFGFICHWVTLSFDCSVLGLLFLLVTMYIRLSHIVYVQDLDPTLVAAHHNKEKPWTYTIFTHSCKTEYNTKGH